MRNDSRLIAGAMSGTSADAVDIAIVQVSGCGRAMTANLLAQHGLAYEPGLRQQIFASRENRSIWLDELARMGRQISLHYARAVNQALAGASLTAGDIAAVAAHGQTLFHQPPDTIQWLDPALIAAETGCAVVSDFRRADCAAGGQGAPLVPFADYILFRDPAKNRVILNIGGIANITWLKAGGALEDVIAFDTGPGNCVIDHLARVAGIPDGIDRDGALAVQGRSDFPTASAAIRLWSRIFDKPPKSADTPEMIHAFERAAEASLPRDATLADRIATACEMSALGVQMSLTHLPSLADEIIVSGGGVHNRHLMGRLCDHLKLPLIITDQIGIPSQAREAIAFALLGAATLDNEPSNVPSATGAHRAAVLGSITPKPA